MNNVCYTDEIIQFTDPIFRTIPTTYVITMHGSRRRDKYMRQLREFRPTARVIILHNRGYRACKKPEWVTGTSSDLWHANLTIASRETGDAPVLVLEDDCVFLPQLRAWGARVEAFLASNDVEAYSLGSGPLLSLPVRKHHTRMFCGSFAHAVIYSAAARKKMIQLHHPPIDMPNHDTWLFLKLRTYTSRVPLAVQAHPPTENSKEWGRSKIPIPYSLLSPFFRCVNAHEDGTVLYKCLHICGRLGGLINVIVLVTVAAFVLVRRQSRRRVEGCCRVHQRI
jgi:hypothetical protein